MAIREIIQDEDPVLRKKSRPVEKFDERLWELLDDMAETMAEANGVGLAACQVGVLRRVVVIDTGDGLLELINPVIVESSGSQTGNEGCLSFVGLYGEVTRPNVVTVQAFNRHGKEFEATGEGLTARAFCHELEHLDGILFIDHAKDLYEVETQK